MNEHYKKNFGLKFVSESFCVSVIRVCFTAIVFFSVVSCTSNLDLPASRKECYRENRCSSADADCFEQFNGLCNLMKTPMDLNNISSNPFKKFPSADLYCDTSFVLLNCSSSRQICYDECNKKSYY